MKKSTTSLTEQFAQKYRSMWTTNKHDYWLIKVPNGGHAIYEISTDALITIEDDEVYEFVIEKLLVENVKQITTEDLNQYLHRIWYGDSDFV
jgi:hypothetical protein